MLRDFLETSVIIFIFKSVYRWYRQIEQGLIDIYHSSHTYRLLNELWGKIKICFRYSFLGRITEIKPTNPAVLDNSRVKQYLVNFYEGWKDKINYNSRTSLATKLAKDIKKELYSSPVRIISSILVIIIFVNASLSFILKKQIDFWAFLIQVLFLFAGAAGLSCQADWPTVKENSVFLRKLWIG